MHLAFDLDAATVLSKGNRSYQEDAIISDFARGSEVGIAVLSDGMGGHAAGDVASKIVVTEVFSDLLLQRCDGSRFEESVSRVLADAAMTANQCLRDHVLAYPETDGMGATLIATVFLGNHLYWISIGDSPLFLFRDGDLIQLNEDHSMAPQLEFMVKSGLMSAEEAARHPDKNALTSVLFGAEIAKIDCPDTPLTLHTGDILIVASDGLQFLSDAQIKAELFKAGSTSSAELADRLMERVLSLNEPDQDNVSFTVVKVGEEHPRALSVRKPGRSLVGLRCVG